MSAANNNLMTIGGYTNSTSPVNPSAIAATASNFFTSIEQEETELTETDFSIFVVSFCFRSFRSIGFLVCAQNAAMRWIIQKAATPPMLYGATRHAHAGCGIAARRTSHRPTAMTLKVAAMKRSW